MGIAVIWATALTEVEFHRVDVTSGVDFIAHSGIFNTSVNDEVASINEGEGVPWAGFRERSFLG